MSDRLEEATKLIGGDISLTDLLLKSAVIRGITHIAYCPSEVVGFNYISRCGGHCFSYYAANPPLIGMSTPMPQECPLGLQAIGEYKIDYKDVFKIVHSINCGSGIVDLSLSWPLTPDCAEPVWHVRTDLGNELSIGANSGKVIVVARDRPADPIMMYMVGVDECGAKPIMKYMVGSDDCSTPPILKYMVGSEECADTKPVVKYMVGSDDCPDAKPVLKYMVGTEECPGADPVMMYVKGPCTFRDERLLYLVGLDRHHVHGQGSCAR